MADPISAISFAAQMFSMAMDAYKIFRKALAFPDSAEKLVLRLKVEYVRLQLWGRNSGLDRGYLPFQFKPFEDIVFDLLKRLTMLFQDSAKLREKYGLMLVDELDKIPENFSTSEAQRTASFFRIKEAWRGIAKLDRVRSGTLLSPTSSKTRHTGKSTGREDSSASMTSRLRWAISSQSQFEALILEIRGFTDSLNNLLKESQQLTLLRDWDRVQLDMLSRVEDIGSLRLVQDVTEGYHECEGIFDMATRKAIVVADELPTGILLGDQTVDFVDSAQVVNSSRSIAVMQKADFDLPDDFPEVARCLARYRNSEHPSSLVLIEKKHYPAELSAEHRELLRVRIKALIHLLNCSRQDRQSLPLCLGYWHDLEDSCWCLVYNIPLPLPGDGTVRQIQSSIQLRTLLHFIRDPVVRPPLEHRIQLASSIAGVLSRLFGSQWLHKSIRSDNIVFIRRGDRQYLLTDSPLIFGFEYSRRYTEASIDLISMDLAQSIYRHPEYQGNQRDRKKYRMAYDVYSFGLMLAEIALWTPLLTIYQERLKRRPTEQSPAFLEPQAMNLREEMVKIVERQLAFKIGSRYRDVVLWCLKQSQGFMIADNELAAKFYSEVVIPLETISQTFR
ncbi:prion-inhibition and propagation-domain-containing protein [Lentinula lateritia]|uniref:Prion-inhibition and propagation-domain-containing protein n=1 Tax=Lentinula lateritia TaxID=40482 RepID=A0ABQ8VFK6_9AGAR|nr:prion-inhibition and propagation-domain-containing protein [Lentinula lateritia]